LKNFCGKIETERYTLTVLSPRSLQNLRMDEGFKLIAKLIVEENEKTRKEILQALKS
jgi:hypothetical protein